MDPRFRLGPGAPAPMQQSAVSCGAACLAVSRMLIDPVTARWVIEGEGGDDRSPDRRFAELERRIMRRTNRVVAPDGGCQLPWPRALGTSPWGALAELESGAAFPDSSYRLVPTRFLGPVGLARCFDRYIPRVTHGSPLLLYVGNHALPRHVCLVFADRTGGQVYLYEPASGAVSRPSRRAFVSGSLGLGGWQWPWLLVAPEARAQRSGARRSLEVPVRAPRTVQAGAPAMLRE